MRKISLALAAWWLWMPAAGLLLWWLNLIVFPGMTWKQQIATDLRVQFFPDMTHPTPMFWLWVAIGLLGTAAICIWGQDESEAVALGGVAVVVVAVLGIGLLVVPGGWHNKMEGQFYDKSLVIHIQGQGGGQSPPSLYYLMQGVTMNDMSDGHHGCVYVADKHDVPSCTVVDKTLTAVEGYEGRTSPYASAKVMMQNANTIPGVSANVDTANYLYGPKPGSGGVWTAVLDGSGKYRHAYGVASWDGHTNTAKTACAFNDRDDKFDRAFGGSRGNSLPNWLADKYPTLHYDMTDVWGYCQGDRPVYVLPVTRYVRFKDRAMSTAAGILVLKGSSHGVAATYRRHVGAGEFPGPVYPPSLVVQQRGAISWAAGRKWRNKNFGFSPTDDKEIQGENPGEYLLRGPDMRLYTVTPLTPGDSPSQTFTAFGVTRADVVNDHQLNTYNLNVLPVDDPRSTNLRTLDNTVANFLLADNASFLNTGGKIQEITPLGGDMWRAYGTRNNQVEWYVDVSANNRVTPKKVTVDEPAPTGKPSAPGQQPPAAVTGSGEACGKPVAQMKPKDIADCLAAISQRTRTLK